MAFCLFVKGEYFTLISKIHLNESFWKRDLSEKMRKKQIEDGDRKCAGEHCTNQENVRLSKLPVFKS